MKKYFPFICFIYYYTWILGSDLPVKYEELSMPQIVQAIDESKGIIIIPVGILEKHGPHFPIRTDLIDVRETVFRAAYGILKSHFTLIPLFYIF